MCGIAGFSGFQDNNLIKQLSEDMKHRGPDGDGFYINEDISLLNRRLAIIDRKGGDQPIFNEDKSIVVVYNGEIYNYQELREELEKLGHTFSTKSDTEVLVHGYEEWGLSSFDRYNGMFGAALYDIKKKKLLLARDQFGIKPIYYHKKGNNLLFSSELKPLLKSGHVERKVNEKILFRYLKFRIHDDQRETFFDGIERVMPGDVLVYENGKVHIHHYSTLESRMFECEIENHIKDKDIQQFRELLTDAVKLRLISEVPVGTCLSGGLDSSTVVALVNKLLNEHVKEAESVGSKQNTFSAVFPGSVNDEEKYIDALLDKTQNVSSHKVFPKPEEFFEDLEDFIRTQEEPTISTGPYAQFQVMREATKHVTVLLDGQGADEMMAGYLPYYFVYLKQLKSRGEYSKLFSEMWASKDVLTKFALHKVQRYFSIKKDVSVSTLLNAKFKKDHKNEIFHVTSDNLKKRLFEDIFKNSLQSLLRYEDRNTMRFSIEGRVPFLDYRLVRYLFCLPDEAIIHEGWNKYILREAAKDILPDMISKRRNKIGFTTPEHEWFMKMKNRIYGVFLSESFANRTYFNQTEVLKAFREFIEGKNDDTLVFWKMLNVELWLREFIDEGDKVKEKKPYSLGSPNEEKKIAIEVEATEFNRYPIRTELFQKGDDYAHKIAHSIVQSQKVIQKSPWYVIVSEKIVAISQGRSCFIWDIKATWIATTLSKFVKKTPYGIGLGSPWTMQIAIDEVGLPRILFATIAAAVTKPFGIKGLFYRLAGGEINAIDGPTEYSVYPSNVSAKLAPKDPQEAAQNIKKAVANALKAQDSLEGFAGVVIIDANDLGRNVLGNATDKPDSFFEEVMRDNPMGQGSEQTPIVILS